MLFDQADRRGGTMTTPLVTAGILNYGDGKEVSSFYYGYARLHLDAPARKDDGTIVMTDPKQAWPKTGYGFQSMRSLAVPLVEIRDGETLNQRIIAPVFAGCTSTAGSVAPASPQTADAGGASR